MSFMKLHNEELNDLYSILNIIRVIKSKRMRCPRHVARMGESVLVGKHEGKRPLGKTCVDERIILRWMFRKWDGSKEWIDLAQNGDRWWAFVNTVINLLFYKMQGIS